MRPSVGLVAALTVLATACTGPSPATDESATTTEEAGAGHTASPGRQGGGAGAAEGIAMAPLPPGAARLCERAPALRPVCPSKAPSLEGAAPLAEAFRPAGDYAAVSVEWGAPRSEGVSKGNAPIRFAHLTVQAGSSGRAFPFPWPADSGRPDLDTGSRRAATLLGRPVWGGRRGDLVLAPSYPFGGVNGDHVIFRWVENGGDYAVSLHAWAPLAEVEAVLKDVVESIPS